MFNAGKKKRKKRIKEGIKLPNPENIRTFGQKENDNYFGILETEIIKKNLKKTQVKEKAKKNYLWRPRKLIILKPFNRNLIEGINTRAVSLGKYSGPFLR